MMVGGLVLCARLQLAPKPLTPYEAPKESYSHIPCLVCGRFLEDGKTGAVFINESGPPALFCHNHTREWNIIYLARKKARREDDGCLNL